MSIPTLETVRKMNDDLWKRTKAFIETGVRASRQPTLKRSFIDGPLDRRFVAGIQLMVNEIGTTRLVTTGGKVMNGHSVHRMVLDYGVTAEGEVVSLFRPQREWRGAELAYLQPVQEWADAVYAETVAAVSKARILARVKAFKEELMAKMWHPDRVAAMLEKGGWELIDAL